MSAFDFDRLPRHVAAALRACLHAAFCPTSCRRAGSKALFRCIAFVAVILGLLIGTKGYFTPTNIGNLAQYAADGGLVVLGLLIVVAVGGIDLSVGSNFAMSAFAALYSFHILNLPVAARPVLSLACGALIGASTARSPG